MGAQFGNYSLNFEATRLQADCRRRSITRTPAHGAGKSQTVTNSIEPTAAMSQSNRQEMASGKRTAMLPFYIGIIMETTILSLSVYRVYNVKGLERLKLS